MKPVIQPAILLRGASAALALCAIQCAQAAQEADGAIVTDRPDFVESSKVAGKGRLQLETSLLFERDRNAEGGERSVATPTLLRLGVHDDLELRLETDGRIHVRHGESGYADTELGLKWHAMDARGGLPSLGVLLHAELPSGSRPFRGSGVRPSLRVVGEWELPSGMSLGVMPGLGREHDDAGRRTIYGILGVVLGKEINERLRGFAELALPRIARSRHGGTQASFDIGAAWLLSDSCQLDAMFSRGLTGRTRDSAFTVGLSFRR